MTSLVVKGQEIHTVWGCGIVSREPVNLGNGLQFLYVKMTDGEFVGQELYTQSSMIRPATMECAIVVWCPYCGTPLNSFHGDDPLRKHLEYCEEYSKTTD